MRKCSTGFLAVFLSVSVSLMMCGCADTESGPDAAVEEEISVDGKEPGTSGQLPSRTLAESLIEYRSCNGNSHWLPQWANAMLRKALEGNLKDADSGAYTYRLRAIVVCNTESYFSMAVQGSRQQNHMAESEKVFFCVNLDMKDKCVLSLADCLDSETVRAALAAGAYVLLDGTDLAAKRVELYNAVKAAEAAEDIMAEMPAGMADAGDWSEILASLPDNMAGGDHSYDFCITRDDSVGIFLDIPQDTDSPAAPEPDADFPVVREPYGDPQAVWEPDADFPVVREPNVDSPVKREPNTDPPAVWEPAVDASLTGEPAVDSPVLLELDADWLALWRKQEETERAEERIRNMFLYEVRSDEGREYAVITGVKEEYRESLWKRWKELAKYNRHGLQIPDEIDGVRVEEIGPDAFNGISGDKISVKLPESIRIIGDRAFAHTGVSGISFPVTWDDFHDANTFPAGLERIGDSAFEGCGLDKVEFCGEEALVIGERAFADNENLWAVYVPTADCVIGEDAFTGCADDLWLVYGENAEGREDLVEEYAERSGLTAVEYRPARLEVNYPEMPLVLTPDVRNFFFGENGEDDRFDSFELSEEAPDYGFEEWHAPCGEFCAGWCDIRMEASSELASADGRYSADNLKSWRGRNLAWAEGVEGTGIGESITYYNYNQWNSNNWLDFLGRRVRNYTGDQDGYMRYTEICIVNGYARSRKTWEENGRVKRLLMYVEDRPYAYLELEDTILPQYFTLPPGDIKSADGGEITFRFVIEDVYPGTVYEDTCLTGLVLEFTGRHGH